MNPLDSGKLQTNDLVVTSRTFGLMRKVLIENLGQEKAKRFLLRFGKDLGEEKANELLTGPYDLEGMVNEIPRMHIGLGHISNITREGQLSYSDNVMKFSDLHGVWHDSFEVDMQLESFGMSDECSCYILSGFASGMMTRLGKEDIFVKEMTCRARGDAHCTFEVKTRSDWENIEGGKLAIFDDQKIVDELEMTYDQLLEKSEVLDKVSNFHSRITESVAKQNDVSELSKIAAEVLDVTTLITDADGSMVSREGQVPAPDVALLLKDRTLDATGTVEHQIESGFILATPILLNARTEGYCCFLYGNGKDIPRNDHLYLERLAVAASLCFLNEKVKFETTERMKINFLDRMLYSQFENSSELALHASYIQPKVMPPFQMISLKPIPVSDNEVLTDHYQILITIAKLLKLHNVHGLLTQKDDDILIFLYALKAKAHTMDTLSSIMESISQGFPHLTFKAGVSRGFDALDQFSDKVKEAGQAANFPTEAAIVHHRDLGVLSTLLENINPEVIAGVAQQELKTLLEPGEKNKELLHTLYVFLKNNQKLEKTMHDLSLSIGGVKYRIGKIEKMLGKDFKDAATTAHLLLMMETLILMGRLSFK
ncbi:V4R domain-containing protein [Salinicoccus bachuensis]|uniref:V4R domain-containing protein n=1 Tax=Salinicoccus bachuensis TaxID=3136731 RepID=A0ABZ3CHI2_9STAP